MRLPQWLERLEALRPEHIELGLARTRQVMAQMALSARLPVPTILVAGTNGKGSAVAYLESIYRQAGYHTGSYTSPHIWRYNERIRVDGRAADDDTIVHALDRVEAARGDIPLTYFEFGTLAAVQAFLQARVDVAILEVGLGGRLDAVNAFEPDLSLIMSIGLDHCAWLGSDRDSIGREKAGILRSGVPAVCADLDPPSTIQIQASAVGAPLQQAGQDFRVERGGTDWCWHGQQTIYANLPYPALAGHHQTDNAAACLAAVTALQDRLPVSNGAIAAGLRHSTLSGRFQELPPQQPSEARIILDVAHNPQAAQALANTLRERGHAGHVVAIVGMLADKDQQATLAPLVPLVRHWHCIGLDGPRGLEAAALAQTLGALGARSIHDAGNMTQALQTTRLQAKHNEIILIFGSFHTIALFPSSPA